MLFSRITWRIAGLSIILLILGACSTNTNESEAVVENNRTLAAATATTPHEPLASITATPKDSSSQASLTATGDDVAEAPAPPTLVIGTPRGDEPIQIEAPMAPAPTQASTTATTSQFDSDGDGFYTYGDLERAVVTVLPAYEFPENYQVTPDTLLSVWTDYKEGGSQWEAGYEETLIGLNYFCAWSYTFLDAYREGDTALMDGSIHRLQTALQEEPVFVSLRDDLSPIVERAGLGDPTQIQQLTDVNCSSTVFISATASPAAGAEVFPSITAFVFHVLAPQRVL